MKPEYILTIVVIIVLWIAVTISESIKKKKGSTGEDLGRIKEAACKILPDSSAYTIAYAKYYERESCGNHSTSYYYNYIVAIRASEMVVIPIQFAGKQIVAKEHFVIRRENVSSIRAEKEWVTFFDKTGAQICTLGVNASNTADGKYFPLNIQQPKEAQAFQNFLEQFPAE